MVIMGRWSPDEEPRVGQKSSSFTACSSWPGGGQGGGEEGRTGGLHGELIPPVEMHNVS